MTRGLIVLHVVFQALQLFAVVMCVAIVISTDDRVSQHRRNSSDWVHILERNDSLLLEAIRRQGAVPDSVQVYRHGQ